MNKKRLFIQILVLLAILAVGILVGRSTKSASSDHDHTGAGEAPSNEDANPVATPQIWTCSMHPQIQQSEPGDCPICGMDLIPLEDDSGADEGPRTMSMSEASRALAEIQTTEVVRTFRRRKSAWSANSNTTKPARNHSPPAFPARIDELFVNYTGIRVKQGEHLARVYSPELLTAQRELLTAYRADPDSSITRAARDKLRLWDLLPEQIEDILERGEATDNFVLKAPIGGVVVAKHVKEGDYVKTG